MKILISYPPLDRREGYPTLGQNRQFQYFKEPTYIYPVVPAQAATLLKNSGYQVVWNDCLAADYSEEYFFEYIKKESPDIITFETKTPVIKQLWGLINKIKASSRGSSIKIVLFGDHVTALPEESLLNSKADYVLTGGDYDFLLLNLCEHIKSTGSIDLESGIYYRDGEQFKNTGNFKLNHDLDSLPFIDRELTQWQLYAYKNGNYKRTPGTYIMSGRDCWWGKCSFCSWPSLYPSFRLRRVDNVLDEIEMLVSRYNVREIMDDTGCFPIGEWLENFCAGAIKRGLNKKIYLDANMRFGALGYQNFRLMKKAGFRLLLFGLESANQDTLDRINKNLKVERIEEDCKAATKAGLFPHITIMFGYPWESYDDALKTLRLGQRLLKKGYAYTMQATIVIPYPGTPLFKECKELGLLKTTDWDDYGMKKAVMKVGFDEEKLMQLAQGMYKVSFNPEFLFRKLLSIRDKDDLRYYLRAAKKVTGHIFDFRGKNQHKVCA